MKRCIFCRQTNNPFTTVEHILPESIGGGDWATLPEGLFCDVCQNRFGSEIEQQAIGDYPFSFFRTFLGIPTKKGKAPWFNSWEGVVRASLSPGTFGYDPSPPFEQSTLSGNKTQIRLLAHPLKPNMICRFLIKMGIEVVANDNPTDVFNAKFDAARNYALTGDKSASWWYFQSEDITSASRYFTQGVPTKEWSDNCRLEVILLDSGAEIFHLKILYLDMFVPLVEGVQPELDALPEPEYRLFWI